MNSVPYRGFAICWTLFTLYKPNNCVWFEKDGQHAGWANTVEQAKEAIDHRLQPPVIVCSWCPDAKERTAAATAIGLLVSHGICGTCKEKVVAP